MKATGICNCKGWKIVAEETGTPAENQVQKIEEEIDKTAEKLDDATTPAQQKRLEDKMDTLLAELRTAMSRLDAVETKVSEPMAPAPEPKPVEKPTEAVKTEGEEEEAKVGKRRLGAW